MDQIVRDDPSIWSHLEQEFEIKQKTPTLRETEKNPQKIEGYPAYYERASIDEQIERLRQFEPKLNPGSRIIELSSRTLLFGSEEIFAIPKWESTASHYWEAVEKGVFTALNDLYHGNFYYGSRFGVLDENHIRHSRDPHNTFQKINAEQDGDILIIQAQFGSRYQGRSPFTVMSHKLYMLNEFGLGIFTVACMLLTHPDRLVSHKNLWVDCPGDEYRHQYSKEFNHVPSFFFHAGDVSFSTYPHDVDFKDSAPATGFYFK